MEGPLPPHALDTTSLPTTRGRLGDWGPTWPTAHSPARGVRGPHLPRDRPGAVTLPARLRPPQGHKGVRGQRPALPPWEGAEGLERSHVSCQPPVQLGASIVRETFRERSTGTSLPTGLHFLQVGRGCRFAGSEMVPPHPHGRRHRRPAFSPLCGAGAGRGRDVNFRTGAHPSPARGKGATAGTEGQLRGGEETRGKEKVGVPWLPAGPGGSPTYGLAGVAGPGARTLQPLPARAPAHRLRGGKNIPWR